MNKKILYSIVPVLLIGIVFVLHQPVLSGIALFQDISGAKLKFIEEEYDFGTIKEGDVVEHIFSFTNIGSDTLIIAQVRASCGCTAALLSTNRIPPKGVGEIKTTFKSKGRAGKQKKTLTVFSNDPDSPAKTLSFRAVIEPADSSQHL